jgi:glycosyltransferase involved in cell wall biosynthesis
VTVIVPCFNAEATLARTLESVANQSHSNIEILIVDDGSTDATSKIAQRFICNDDRMRLVSCHINQGVAAARNLGVERANGEFIAPIDADDLWHPNKLELLLRPLIEDPTLGLAYSWFEYINEDDEIFYGGSRYSFEGSVIEKLCKVDFIGNGSNAVMRTALVRQVGGYDASLRARGAEGSEDWKLALQLAELSRFAVVKQPLTGYRLAATNMSNRVTQMVSSAELVVDEFSARHIRYARALRVQLLSRIFYGIVLCIRRGQWRDAEWLCRRAGQFGASDLLEAIWWFTGNSLVGSTRLVTRVVRRGFVSRAPRPQFLDVSSSAVRKADLSDR